MSRSYVESVLLPGEALEFAGRLHWVIFLPGLCSAIGGSLLCILPPDWFTVLLYGPLVKELHNYLLFTGLSMVGGGVLMLSHAYLRLISTELAITNRRVIAKTGFISRNTFEIMLGRVEGANIEQSVWGRVLGYGSIFVHGTGGGVTPIDHVVEPLTFKKNLMMGVENVQGREQGN